MSSSKPLKSCSGSVHDSDSESSIEYVQTQSPLSPNLPLTTPIASLMNVSGLNIDVGNSKAQTSSTWSFPNISTTPISQIPLIHKWMCLRGQKAHLKSHQTLIPNQNFRASSSLILVRIQSHPTIPLYKVNSQPSIFHHDLMFMWAMKSGLMVGNEKDYWKMLLRVIWHLKASDELYASSALVHKERVTGHHHPNAPKPRTGHASSSRDEIVDDED
ncbi:hypothetical protein O181_066328 [Austropuccinia psidii MF-1]|uniref:Uncharacterized protein n=1 Tax=Austropuccinia psidii MF-1 TaxID=1389203 RepID=A0A9Q3I3I2_9BASI|nr:hypothetical protein [Austropuccinia psidii MF-1]